MPTKTLFQDLEYPPPIDFENFDQVFECYGSSLYGIIYNTVNDAAVAEMLAGEAFVLIFRNKDLYEPHRHRIFIWMLSVTIKLLKQRGYDYKMTGTVIPQTSSYANTDRNPGSIK